MGNDGYTGHVQIYRLDSTSWNKLGQNIDGEASGDIFGGSVSMSSDGKTVAIGAYRNDGNGNDSGHVRIFTWDSTSWNQLGQDIDGEASDDLSGASVSISSDGTTVAIGSPGNDGYTGHVRIFRLDSTS